MTPATPVFKTHLMTFPPVFCSVVIFFFFFKSSPGTIEIPVLRHGSDLTSLTSVWCATRPSDPPSASPGVDYIPSSKKVEFKPGRTVEVRTLSVHRYRWKQTKKNNRCGFLFKDLQSNHHGRHPEPIHRRVRVFCGVSQLSSRCCSRGTL